MNILGAKVYIDSDQEDWGRVTGEAEILDILSNGDILVRSESIRADIIVLEEDCHLI